ncbi:putative membrane protein [Motilibacter peucedani]|uniref:Putative membrane protein n=1 Tax=Motilibacter peucedani TaxID=598650 RepID=A0A420XQ03_9ACTN|nr:DUF1345 domain-containing protein [Motilibacter peucedani]RKS75325.1 putative membrane protein [Motilibacter peucedani]
MSYVRERPRTSGRRILSSRRLLLSLAGGVVVGAVVAALGLPQLAVLVGWGSGASAVLVWVWRISWPQDHRGTKRLAEDEGSTRATDGMVLAAAVASLAAVVQALVGAARHDAVGVVTVLLCVLDAIVSWALVNTVFALKYARLYFAGGDGGIDFSQEDPPAYSDFAYLAFTVGMSYAVADDGFTSRGLRKVGLGHALLSYLFGTVVIAVAVSLLTNLGQ